jgi:hypothetical protein
MPEPEDSAPSGLHLPASDPAASAVEALRAMAVQQPVQASAELAAFLNDPTGEGLGTSPHSRSDLVTVVRLPIRRVGRAAVAVGAAVALAALGGVAVAATGGGQNRGPAHVQQDDPSDTTTTTEATDTETTTAEPEDTDTESSDTSETSSSTHTANATASANHHDGVGADDEHADVNGGGEVDHRAEHSPTAHPTGGGDDDADESGDEQAPASQPGGGSHRH